MTIVPMKLSGDYFLVLSEVMCDVCVPCEGYKVFASEGMMKSVCVCQYKKMCMCLRA